MDFTLIKTKSGAKFPKNGDDWVISIFKKFKIFKK